jgi:uncharacterized protein (TIGR02145 family)
LIIPKYSKMNQKKPFIWVTYFFMFSLVHIALKAQEPIILDSKMKPGISNDMRIEELKVRWKKAALENCPGVPCVTTAVPGAPTAVVATAGNASASVAFVAPTNNGGSAITGYTVTSNPGNITAPGATSPISVTGLTNGTPYTFTVVATNAIGNSVASAASTAVTPVAPNTVPGFPTSVVATAGNALASVAFVAPTNNGGSAITGYTVTSNPGGITATGGATSTSINVTGLTNGTPYTFTVVATNAIGNSLASTASTAVTPANACGSITTVLDGDGNSYQTVGIGTQQCWTKTNLKTTTYNDGVTSIPDETANTSGWGSLTTGARSEYVASGVTGYVSTYGYLYNWYAAAGIFSTVPGTTPKNICPVGWHVPTETDWTNLINYIGTTPGTRLRENSSLWAVNTGTDQYGFSARPSGWRNSISWFRFIGSDANFWTATYDVINNSAVSVAIDGNQDGVFIGAGFQAAKEGYSIRCLKN